MRFEHTLDFHKVDVQFSLVSLMLLTAAFALQFRSAFMLNVGISITAFVLLIGLPTTYSMWTRRRSLKRTGQERVFHAYLATCGCAVLNAALIAYFILSGTIPEAWNL